VSASALIQETPLDFRVHASVFTDQGIFDEEMRNIFSKTWVYVAHESQLPNPGDYLTTYIGQLPVIVSRGDDRQLRVLLNACRHRGNTVCREERGNAAIFRCSYHGWLYKNTGELAGISNAQGYPEDVASGIDGLTPVPRMAIYRGLIFASMDRQMVTLEDYLGDVKSYLDLWLDLAPGGTMRIHRPHKFDYPANWKLQMENGVDGYHPTYVHESAFTTMSRFRGRTDAPGTPQGRVIGLVKGFECGHAMLERPGMLGLQGALMDEYRAALVQAYGSRRTEQILSGHNILIFPSLYLMDANIRVIQPVTVDRTLVDSYFVEVSGVPDHINTARLRDLEFRLGTSGLIGPADLEIFAGVQTAVRGKASEWLLLSRGLGNEELYPSGARMGDANAETPQRAMYRAWQRLMSTHSPAAAAV